MSTQDRIEEVRDRIHAIARWMEKGTNSETTWTHTAMRLRFYTRRLSVLTRGLAYLNNEAVAIHNAA